MAYWIDSSDSGRHYTSEHIVAFMCDDTSDIPTLPTSSSMGVQQGADTISCRPCDKGSSCMCLGSSELYILNSKDQWIAI